MTRCQSKRRLLPTMHGPLGLLLALLIFLAPVESVSAERDRMETVRPATPGLSVTPSSLLSRGQRDIIGRLVVEFRSFGAPVSVVVERVDAPIENPQEAADDRYDETPVESSRDADDGMLWLIQVPQSNHRATTVAVATGDDFYPRGGLTPAVVQDVIDREFLPSFERNAVGQGIINGLTLLSYTHLFRQAPASTIDGPTLDLQRIIGRAMAPALGVLALGLLAIAWSSHRRNRRAADVARTEPHALTAVEAATLAAGRADRPVLAGLLLRLDQLGAIRLDHGHGERAAITVPIDAGDLNDAERQLLLALHAAADPHSGRVDPAAFPLPRKVERTIADAIERPLRASGLLASSDGPDRWLLTAAVAVIALSLQLLVPSVIGHAGLGILAAAVSIAIAGAVIWWYPRRSDLTDRGKAALAHWLQEPAPARDEAEVPLPAVASQEDRALFDLIAQIRQADIDVTSWPRRSSYAGSPSWRAARAVAGIGDV